MNQRKKHGRGGGHPQESDGVPQQHQQKRWVPKSQTQADETSGQQLNSESYDHYQEEFSKKENPPTEQQTYYPRGGKSRGTRGRGYQNEYEGQSQRGRGNGGRGRGRGRGYNQYPTEDQYYQSTATDFFDQRKAEREMMDGNYQEGPQNAFNQFSQDGDRVWSKKMDQYSKSTRQAKNLGSAAHYIGSTEDSNKKYLPKAQEKIQYVKSNQQEQEELNALDQANIKYNPQDFLNTFQNLTEQCAYLVETLSKGSQECIICHNPIYQRSALWNCKQCHQPFHLGCIKKWIKKLNNAEDIEEEKKSQPVRRPRNQNQHQEGDEDSQAYQQAKKLLAFFSWTCPNCNYSYAENKVPQYRCFCGKQDEPSFSPLVLPHSCGEYCDKLKNELCTHGRCEVLCHPGSCPPCNINIPVTCFCGKEDKKVPCQFATRSKYSCDKACERLLNCRIHECPDICHNGPCSPCQILITQKCYCEKDERKTTCGNKKFLCGKVCGKSLDCGKHTCQRVCHEGACSPCQKAPSKVKFCPCGRVNIEKLTGGKQRTECTDPIPTCKSKCEKFLPCGKHQCSKTCHNDECETCQASATLYCLCEKDKRQVPCYTLNYPEHLKEQMMTTEELQETNNYKCKKICNQMKSCNKHKCKEICCPAKKGYQDPMGRHLCLVVCNKTLACGKHQCNSFCHLGYCKPCRTISNQPLFCPCGTVKVDPPIPCGTVQPTCHGPCQKELACGHQCSIKCHLGNCPPCLEIVTKVCNCGREVMPNVYCNQTKHSCGNICNQTMPCGHKCNKVCHQSGMCFNSESELMQKGCGETCGKTSPKCKHRCQQPCHPQTDCPDTPCEAEIRLYCKCGSRFVNAICKSITDREPIECNSECWKVQRDKRLAQAFGSSKKFEENKASIAFEYYPEDVLEFGKEHPKFVKKCESMLTDIVLEKSSKSFTSLGPNKRSFLTTLVFEHFKLDMCTYGGKNSKTVTDVFWKEGCKVPDILVSDVVTLIEKGIMSANSNDTKTMVFEATLHVYNIPKSNTINDLKKFMLNFKNEMYAEKGKAHGEIYLHFYNKMRGKDAFTYLKNTPSQFTSYDLILHKKEIGTSQEPIGAGTSADVKRKKKEAKVMDDEGFTMVK